MSRGRVDGPRRVRLAVLWTLGLAGSPAALADDCPDRENLGTTPAMVEERLTEAEALYPSIYDDFTKLSEIEVWVRDGMSCLTEPAPVALVVRFHRFQAVATDPLGGLAPTVRDRVRGSLAAVQRLDPDHAVDLPEDHGHRDPMEASSGGSAVPAPNDGTLFFDGMAGLERPATSTFFQRQDASGKIVDAAYLEPSEAMPGYPQPVAVGAGTGSEGAVRNRPAKLRTAAVGVGLGAIGLAGGSLVVRQNAMFGPNASADRAHDAQPLVNGLAVGSWALGLTSAGLFTGSLVAK